MIMIGDLMFRIGAGFGGVMLSCHKGMQSVYFHRQFLILPAHVGAELDKG